MTATNHLEYSLWALRGDDEANWRESYSNRTIFELADAAFILAGVQPEYPDSLDSETLTDIKQWRQRLKDHIHELLAKSGYNEKNPDFHRLSHDKLRAWCDHNQIQWPIPDGLYLPMRTIMRRERELRLAAEEKVFRLRAEKPGIPQPAATSNAVDALIFPYATKALIAMRDAALAHWVNHNPKEPAPHGIQKAVRWTLSQQLGNNERKLAELASAIKPDDLPVK